MRNFSDQEKQYLEIIVNAFKSETWGDRILKNLIYKAFKREITFNEFPGFELKVGESGDKEKNLEYKEAIIKGYIPIANFISLLDYLKSINLVFVVPYFDTDDFSCDSISGPNEQIERNSHAESKKWFSIADHSFMTFLRNNYANLICPTQELIDFVDNKFLTKDQKKYRTQLILTLISIGIAIIIGLGGFLSSHKNSQKPIEINSNQFNTLIESSKYINQNIQLLIKQDSLESVKLLNEIKLFKQSKQKSK